MQSWFWPESLYGRLGNTSKACRRFWTLFDYTVTSRVKSTLVFRNDCAEGSFSTSWKQARLSRYPESLLIWMPSLKFIQVSLSVKLLFRAWPFYHCIYYMHMHMHMYAFHIAHLLSLDHLVSKCRWIFGLPKPGILGWQEPEKAHLSFTHLGRCAISCDLCQQMHARMPTFCQEKREKEKDAGTKSVLNCLSYGFCCLTWPWAVVQYLSPKVRRKLKTCTLSTCVFSPQIPVWRFSFFMRHDESKWGKKKASASASIVACTPHLHGFSRVRGLQHWRQKIKRQALGKMLVRCKVFDWRLAKVRRPEAYSFAPRNYSFAVIRWGW